MSDRAWINHPKYGTVYQPSVSGARADFHGQYDAWYGEEYDRLSHLMDELQYAAMRTVLNDLRSTLVAADDPHLASVVKAIDAMQERIDDHQYGEQF